MWVSDAGCIGHFRCGTTNVVCGANSTLGESWCRCGRARAPARLKNAFSLDQLDVTAFHVFSIVSRKYWRLQRPVVRGFIAHLAERGIPAFIVGRARSVCHGVQSSEAGTRVACVVGNTFSEAEDAYGMMERWVVIHHFLSRGQRIAFAGVDVRFFRPLAGMFAMAIRAGAVDGAFDASMTRSSKRVQSFTPDVILAMPTPSKQAARSSHLTDASRLSSHASSPPRLLLLASSSLPPLIIRLLSFGPPVWAEMLAFVTSVLIRRDGSVYDGLPLHMHNPNLTKHARYLMGPGKAGPDRSCCKNCQP